MGNDDTISPEGSFIMSQDAMEQRQGKNWLFRRNPSLAPGAVVGSRECRHVHRQSRFRGNPNPRNSAPAGRVYRHIRSIGLATAHSFPRHRKAPFQWSEVRSLLLHQIGGFSIKVFPGLFSTTSSKFGMTHVIDSAFSQQRQKLDGRSGRIRTRDHWFWRPALWPN